jgi:alkanesulfonate monooxygenase SsuD/methylene tetrahydromethanopterin reductase-like flavin-dependent oxidoreductase (luciferase family)
VDTTTTREEWEEATKLLPELWSQDNFSYHGQFFDWDDKITVVPRPVQKPHPPLWLAASQPATCALAGEKGLGLLMPSLTTPERLTESVQAYKQAVAAPLDQIGAYAHDQCVLTTVAFCNEDDEKARIVGGEAGAWYLKNLSEIYQNDWAGEPIDSIPDSYRYHAQIREDSRRLNQQVVGGGNWGSDVQLDVGRDDAYVELIDSGAFCIGDPAKVIANVMRYRATGADRLACISQLGDIRHEDIMRSIELFGREIMPAVRAAEEAEEAENVAAGVPTGA